MQLRLINLESAMIGQPISRVDGLLKVTGKATYAYERSEQLQPLYGFIVGATVGRGRITHIDAEQAEHAPGVRLVMTYQNAPRQGIRDDAVPDYWRAWSGLSNPENHHDSEPRALVVSTTHEQSREP